MQKIEAFGKWVSRWFTVFVIVWAAFNYFLPGTSTWVVPSTSYLLGIILLGMGLTLRGEDFARIIKKPVPVILGTVAHYVIMPTSSPPQQQWLSQLSFCTTCLGTA